MQIITQGINIELAQNSQQGWFLRGRRVFTLSKTKLEIDKSNLKIKGTRKNKSPTLTVNQFGTQVLTCKLKYEG